VKELDQWWRIGGGCAIGFVVLGIVAFIFQADAPFPNDSASDIRAYFVDDGDRYMVGDVFWGLAMVLGFLPFAAAFTAYLGMAEGQPRPWSRLAFGFAIALIAMTAAMSMVGGGLAYSAAESADDSILKTSLDMLYYGETLISSFLAIGLALSASLVILKNGVLWRWLGWLGIALALCGFISVFAVFDDDPEGTLGIFGFLVFAVFAVWILAIGIALLRATAPPATSSST